MIQTSENNYLLHANNLDECITILKERALNNSFYSEISPQSDTLICLNPFKKVPHLFSNELMNKYFLKETNEPHLFKYATWALESILDRDALTSQAILVTGESGSGKTSSINYLVSYFSYITRQSNHEISIEKMLLYTNPLLEAFGNASTVQNENSSRFGKYIQLRFSSSKQSNISLKSVKIKTYLLEKTRATRVPDNLIERNFHIFYQMIAGASRIERDEWLLNNNLTDLFQPNETDLQNWLLVKEAFLFLKIPNYTEIFKLISFISNMLAPQLELNNASYLLGFSNPNSLDSYLNFQELRIGSNLVKRMCSLAETRLRKDALIKLIYVKLFKWLVNELNKKFLAISQNEFSNEKYIGLLDIYGFENLTINSFEQLCINYANEKMHQIFVDSHLKSVHDECLNELIDWTPIDCDNGIILNQLESNPRSLFSILNEECILRRDIVSRRNSEQTTLNLIEKILSPKHQHICETKPYKSLAFTIRHYAGDVDYKIDEFIEKNKDQIPDDLMRFLSTSTNVFLIEILNEIKNNKKKKTVLDKFRFNLNALIQKLKETQIYYVRCIRPNKLKLANTFDIDLIRKQLEACGISALIDLDRRFKFRYKFEYAKFCQKYFPLLIRTRLLTRDPIRTAESIVKQVDERDSFRLGKTKIFLNDTLKTKLNTQLELEQTRSATRIQSMWRMHVIRAEYLLKRQSAIRLQKWFRMLSNESRNNCSSINSLLSSRSASTSSTITLFSCTSTE